MIDYVALASSRVAEVTMRQQREFMDGVKKKVAEREFKPKFISRKQINDRRRAKTAKRIEWRKKYVEEHHDELLRKHREYNASEHGKQINSRYNKTYRELKGEEEKARKRAWYHAHKTLKGVPRGRKKGAKKGVDFK